MFSPRFFRLLFCCLSLLLSQGMSQVVSTMEPTEITGFDQYSPVLQKVIRDCIDLTKKKLSYQFGSSDPKLGGMDCSGTIYHVLMNNGIKDIPRSSDQQYLWLKEKSAVQDTLSATSLDDPVFSRLKPGDLLFWNGTYAASNRAADITHVMIYLGKARDGLPVMFGASDGRYYRGQRQNGVSLFDLQLPRKESKARFVGFGSVPGLSADLAQNTPPGTSTPAPVTAQATAPDNPRSANIVLILADDLGWQDLSCYGGTRVKTPRLDALAAGGVRFTQGYVTAPIDSPSRAGLLSGRYQQRFGYEFNPMAGTSSHSSFGLPSNERLLSERLAALGHATSYCGKWHLGTAEPAQPQKHGYAEFFGFLGESHFHVPAPGLGYYSRLRADEPAHDTDNFLLRGQAPVMEKDGLTTAFSREAAAFILRQKDKPFFLTLSYHAPGFPMQARIADVDKFPGLPAHQAIHAGMMAELDEGVGTVLDQLKTLGLEEKTLVIFLGDNGGHPDLASDIGPFKGRKGSLTEGGIRIPFLMSWPGKIPAGKTFDAPVSSLDIVPTALAAAAEEKPAANFKPDGVNLLPWLKGEKTEPPHPVLMWRTGGQAALRQGDRKLHRPASDKPWELYDLAADPGEKNDLAPNQETEVKKLSNLWQVWNREMAKPLWSESGKKTPSETPKKSTTEPDKKSTKGSGKRAKK